VVIVIRIAICDDEPVMLADVAARLKQYAEENRTPIQSVYFANGQELLDSSTAFDVLFLDIQMGSPDGMESARQLRARGFPGLLIFMTILKEAVFEAFEVQAFDYLVKPLDNERFDRVMTRAVKELQARDGQSLVINRCRGIKLIPLSNITYCEVIGRKIYLRERDGSVTEYYEKMERLCAKTDQRFFRCHRSYLVNLDYVRGCREGNVILADGSKIPVSRLRERELTVALLQRIKERKG